MSDGPATGAAAEPRFQSGVLIGWRAWRLRRGDLVSISSGEVWPHRRRLEATHKPTSVDPDHPDTPGEVPPCIDHLHCGVYAYKQPADIDKTGDVDVWGEVKLWGKVVEHELAYRAQFAYPSMVVVRSDLDAQLIRRNYGCDVMVDDTPKLPNAAPVSPPVVAPAVVAGSRLDAMSARLQSTFPAPSRTSVPMVNFSVQTYHGQCFTYAGAADPEAIASWFAGLLEAHLIADVFAMPHSGMLQWRFNAGWWA